MGIHLPIFSLEKMGDIPTLSSDGWRRTIAPVSETQRMKAENAIKQTFLGGVEEFDQFLSNNKGDLMVSEGSPVPRLFTSGNDEEGPTALVDYAQLHANLKKCTSVPVSGFSHQDASKMKSKAKNTVAFRNVLRDVHPLLEHLRAGGYEVSKMYAVVRKGGSKSAYHSDFSTGRFNYWWRFQPGVTPVDGPVTGMRVILNVGGLQDPEEKRPFYIRVGPDGNEF